MKILISGGSGMIGSEISEQLLAEGHEVAYLSRNPGQNKFGVREYFWDPDKSKIDESALEGTDVIVHLAGATLFKRWTPGYKSKILRSRVDGSRLLYDSVCKWKLPLKAFISASAVGYYPDHYEKEFSEEDPPGSDFLSLVCQKWEQETQNFTNINVRAVRLRMGIVLSNTGGALPQVAKPVKYGFGAALGTGRQWMPWIHIEDVARIFVHVIHNEGMEGVYNAVGPYNVTNEEFTREVAHILHRPLLIPNVPKVLLKLYLGEMAAMPLGSTKVSNKKIVATAYNYKFNDLHTALEDLLERRT